MRSPLIIITGLVNEQNAKKLLEKHFNPENKINITYPFFILLFFSVNTGTYEHKYETLHNRCIGV